ncbi:MAG TPA: YIP1 family protein [Deinococcales bacterium]|nr:YIP1 family protein [Deinococcales bacterium]
MTTPAASGISAMFAQSLEVLSKPSVSTFERFEKRGTVTDAAIYVAITAAIAGVFGLANGLSGFLGGVIGTVISFFVFAGLVYYIGKSQGGTGTFDEVAYTFSLFWVPITVAVAVLTFLLVITLIGILLLPLLAILAVIAEIWFGYMAVQSSMNLTQSNKIWTTLILAGLGSLIVNVVVLRL